MRYLAADVYAVLENCGCTYEVDRYPSGQAWLALGHQVFFLPDPDEIGGVHWFDVLDDNLKDRWLPFSPADRLTRH